MSDFVRDARTCAGSPEDGLLADVCLRADSTAVGTVELPSDPRSDCVKIWLQYWAQQHEVAETAGEEKGASCGPEVREATDKRLEYLTQVARLRLYVQQAEQAGLVAHRVAAVARQIWTQLSAATGNELPVPDACPGPDGDFLYSWDRDDHHFEVEIEPGAAPMAFYWNRKTGETWNADLEGARPVPERVLATLRVLLR